MRLAAQSAFGIERLWVAGSLMSKIVFPVPTDGLDKAPGYSYSNVHVDQFNLHQYHFSALLYLSEAGKDFDGGEFEFIDADTMKSDELSSQEELDAVVQELYEGGATIPQEH